MDKKKPENRFFRFGEENTDEKKASRILYIAVIAVLCLAALTIGIASALNRHRAPKDVLPDTSQNEEKPSDESDRKTDTEPTTDVDVDDKKIPEMLVPTVGSLAKKHDNTNLTYNLTTNDYRTHSGIDIAAAAGAKVIAVADGTVKEIKEDPLMGMCLVISMKGDCEATYRNLGAVAEGLKEGSTVKAGDTVGTVGDNAMVELADEPHLHFELTVGKKEVDPLSYFTEESRAVSLITDTTTAE